MTTPKKEAPVLVAEFPEETKLWEAVRALEERKIGRDFIGVLISENEHDEPNGQKEVHLLSALAPRRLHEEIRSDFVRFEATDIGNPREMAARHGAIPHPGAFEDHGMKLPMGLEFPNARRKRRND